MSKSGISSPRTPYLLLLPGIAFLFTFFIWPIANLAQTSTQTPIAGGDTGEYEQTLRWRNYIDAFIENKEQFGRSFLYAALATIIALAIAYPLAYRSPDASSVRGSIRSIEAYSGKVIKGKKL